MLFLTDVDHVSFEKANETRQNNIASALSFHVIQYNNGCSWRASFPSRKSGVFCLLLMVGIVALAMFLTFVQ